MYPFCLKYSDILALFHMYPKLSTNLSYKWLPEEVSKCCDGIAKSADLDQTAPKEAVWPGSTLYAQTYLSEYLE